MIALGLKNVYFKTITTPIKHIKFYAFVLFYKSSFLT